MRCEQLILNEVVLYVEEIKNHLRSRGGQEGQTNEIVVKVIEKVVGIFEKMIFC